MRVLPFSPIAPVYLMALCAFAGCRHDHQRNDPRPGGGDGGEPGAQAEGPNGGTAGDASVCAEGPERNGPYERVTVAGDDSEMGLIDPSVEYAADARVGYMTYTAVPSPVQAHISIASSEDNGASWHYVGDVTPPAPPITITTTDDSVCGSSSCSGTFAQESSSLVIDPLDPDPDRLFKVFAHTYFYSLESPEDEEATKFDLGYIALYTASSAKGPWEETALFGWPSSSPISNASVAYDIAVDPALSDLADCLIVGEPGAVVRPSGAIDLALSCVSVHEGGEATIDIRLLRSDDHGVTWTFVGSLLTPEDAQVLGAVSHQINGADLFFADGAYHLIATPIGLVSSGDQEWEGYRGCVVVAIDDLDAAQVSRCEGKPIVEASYLGQPGQFVGACSSDAGATASGMLIPVPDLTFSSSDIWQLFASGTPIP